MNSFRVSAGSRQPPLTADFDQELLGGVGPPDRLSPAVALGEEGQDALTHVGSAVKVIGRERLPLQLAEHDLDLVEPGGIDRQPMEVDGERQVERLIQAGRRLGACVEPLSRIRCRPRIRRHQTLPKSIRRKLWNSTKRLRSKQRARVSPVCTSRPPNSWTAPRR
jgi:hypothetical protein